jgi:hypothetical protein
VLTDRPSSPNRPTLPRAVPRKGPAPARPAPFQNGQQLVKVKACAGSQGSSTPMKKTAPPFASTRARTRSGVISPPLPKRSLWYAVSVIVDSEACDVVRALGKTRWLAADAPRFPLLGCDVTYCGCRYRHYSDRRTKAQRFSDCEKLPRQHKGPERRGQTRGRRSTDI